MHTAHLKGRMSLKTRTMALLLGSAVLALAPTLVKAQDIGGIIGGLMMGGGGGGYYHSGRSHRQHYSSRHESRHASRRHHRGEPDEDAPATADRSPDKSGSGGNRTAERPAEKPPQESAPVIATSNKAPAKSDSDDPVLPPAR